MDEEGRQRLGCGGGEEGGSAVRLSQSLVFLWQGGGEGASGQVRPLRMEGINSCCQKSCPKYYQIDKICQPWV